MSDKKLVFYGNETLAQVAEPVSNIDGSIISLIDEMFEVMYKEQGIGLAAPQINVSKRIFVVDIGDKRVNRIALINPVIKEFSDKIEPYEEGCLSLPGINADVLRPDAILISGITPEGSEVEIEARGLLARVFQHEYDHLNGILFIDRIEKYIKDELKQELKKIKKMSKKAG
ncbi:MAG TPA: peptide deformylase [Spirochaetota bacterium]|jgi:peptide deformylase|nr:peptide deformylase [Spirochaetota bacterium]OQA99904.1 MAG: Peptide deformylase [Spirochaetes bacterium ADurb.Bin218]HOK02164.1 peptide deformylase [Spirochaetota bacterium]HOK92649.1 peptide deformylase [Spirochaetota bacterium]HON15340.1 peptide deformylase [Spirochaetota bacterium]